MEAKDNKNGIKNEKKEPENRKDTVKDTKKKEFKALAKAFKKKTKVNRLAVLEPYKKDIYKLKFEKQASYQEIVNLFKQIGLKVSKEALGRFFGKKEKNNEK
jgi:hypothetical protein